MSSSLREQWAAFLEDYTQHRRQLRLFVHLIDGQVGPQDVDLELMQMVARGLHAGCSWQYAIVLTKVPHLRRPPPCSPVSQAVDGLGAQIDKIGGKANPQVEMAVEQAVRSCGCDVGDRIIRTSARTKYGRDDAWRLLRPVVLASDASSSSVTT